MPKPSEPPAPDVIIGETARRRPILNNFWVKLAPTQDAANFLAELKYEAAAIEPPHPAPLSAGRALGSTQRGGKRGICSRCCEAKFGVRQHYLSQAHLSLAQLLAIVAGEIVGARRLSRGEVVDNGR